MRTRSVLYAAWLSGGASGGLEVVFSHVRRGSVDSRGYVVLFLQTAAYGHRRRKTACHICRNAVMAPSWMSRHQNRSDGTYG